MDGTKYEYEPSIQYIPNDEVYIGYFDTEVINKMQTAGILSLLAVQDDERQVLKLVEREDFLSSFEAGAREARLGNDLHYADYANNQYAFSCGYEHWQARNKHAGKSRFTHYSLSNEFVCHGFIEADSGDIYRQY